MGKNNNNAGMHFLRHSNYRQYDNLAYYDKNSAEGIANRKSEAIANLEEMGKYLFTKSASFIQISSGDGEFDFPKFYEILIYDKEHEKVLKPVSTIKKLYNQKSVDKQEVKVRVHDRQNIIYIASKDYEEQKHILNKQIVYKFK